MLKRVVRKKTKILITSPGVDPAYIYVISGGDSSFANTSALSRYDVPGDVRSSLTPIPTSRTQIGAASIGGKIYVPGGYGRPFLQRRHRAFTTSPTINGRQTHRCRIHQQRRDGRSRGPPYLSHRRYSGACDLNFLQVYWITWFESLRSCDRWLCKIA
jgi:hypothetical protein